MVQYICQKCSKTFIQKCDYDRHLKRKKLCSTQNHIKPQKTTQNDDIFKCKYCEHIFARKDALNRHIDKHCKIKKKLDDSKEQLFQKLLLEHDELLTLMERVKKLEDENIKYKQIIK